MVSENAVQDPEISLVRLILSCMVAGGVQYGWALQLSLLTPYVQVKILSFSIFIPSFEQNKAFVIKDGILTSILHVL